MAPLTCSSTRGPDCFASGAGSPAFFFFLLSIFLNNASAQNTAYKPENSKEINFVTYQELRKLNLEIKIKSVFNDGTILNKPKYDSLVANAEIFKISIYYFFS